LPKTDDSAQNLCAQYKPFNCYYIRIDCLCSVYAQVYGRSN